MCVCTIGNDIYYSYFQFSVKFSFSPNDLSPKPNAHECHFEGKLQIKFSFGVVQVLTNYCAISM